MQVVMSESGLGLRVHHSVIQVIYRSHASHMFIKSSQSKFDLLKW